MEDPGLIHPAFGHQEMEVQVEIDPGSKCLNGGDDPGPKLAARDSLKITGQAVEGAAAELPPGAGGCA